MIVSFNDVHRGKIIYILALQSVTMIAEDQTLLFFTKFLNLEIEKVFYFSSSRSIAEEIKCDLFSSVASLSPKCLSNVAHKSLAG